MHTETPQQISLLFIILAPLLGAIINGLFGKRLRRPGVTAVGVGSVLVSFVFAVLAFTKLYGLHHHDPETAALIYRFYEWFSLSLPGGREVPIEVGFYMDQLSGIMTLVVTGIGGLIHLYSVGYMSDDPGYPRFFAYLNLFTASMLILVLGINLPVMFVGWEGVGLCSYLLIGFWYENGEYAAAGRKAFVANRIGDFGVLIGMFILVGVAGSFDFTVINEAAAAGAYEAAFPVRVFGVGATMATVACLFLFLGCTGKSAQIPLFVWLPDAMAGPTPVSALIHAATMVTAGVYLCNRLSPLFITSDVAMAVIAVIGTLTALLAASIALVQREMKKILAYSTVSQLGFMFAAVGVGFFAAGFFHVFTHAFFKGCLFLGAGSVMHAVHAHGDADIFKLGGLKKYMPITRWTFLFSCLAIAGVPLTSGFFSKEEILLGAAAQAHGGHSALVTAVGWFTLIGLSAAAVMTAFYMFRLYFLTFTGDYRSAEGNQLDHPYDAHPHESPSSMTIPLLVLGVGALVVGFLGLPHIVAYTGTHLPSWWGHWLEPAVAGRDVPEAIGTINLASTLGLLAMAIGIVSAWLLYRNKSEDAFSKSMPEALHSFLFDKWRVDELYAATVINPLKKIATAVGHVDLTFVDGLMTRLPSLDVRLLGRWFAKAQTGVLQLYGMVLVLGATGVLVWFWNPHPRVQAEAAGATVELSAPPGLGYQYRWDANSDGTFDRGWSTDPNYAFSYSKDDLRGATLRLGSRGTGTERELRLSKAWQTLPLDRVDPLWRRAGSDPQPSVRLDGQEVLLRTNGARTLQSLGGEVVPLRPGRNYKLGTVQVTVHPIVEATVEVRNAFGNVKAAQRQLSIPFELVGAAHAELAPVEVLR
jgi:NADH-quinone oxidoreductase subunit L